MVVLARARIIVGLTGIAAASLLALAPAADAAGRHFTLSATVIHVVDGDTIDVKLATGKRERVRLIGIDAPEVYPLECFGTSARTRARALAQAKRVVLRGDRTQGVRDRFGRLLAYVELPSGDLGRRLVADGFATVYVFGRPFARLKLYRAAEALARSAFRGLWRACEGGASTSPPAPPPAPPPPTVPPPTPPPAASPPPAPAGSCHPSYPTVCIPPAPPDLDCGDILHRRFPVRHDVADPDPHRFDGDKDGVGCEGSG